MRSTVCDDGAAKERVLLSLILLQSSEERPYVMVNLSTCTRPGRPCIPRLAYTPEFMQGLDSLGLRRMPRSEQKELRETDYRVRRLKVDAWVSGVHKV